MFCKNHNHNFLLSKMVVVASNILLFLFAIITVYGATVNPPIGEGVDELLADTDSPAAWQVRKDVLLKFDNYNSVDIILTNGFLDVEVDLQSCSGKSTFCYQSTDKMDHLNDICHRDGFCAFSVEGTYEPYDYGGTNTGHHDRVYFGGSRYFTMMYDENMDRKDVKFCENKIIRMQYWRTIFCKKQNGGYITSYSCAPKMDSQNKIQIVLRGISSSCSIKIKNAQIYHPPPTTTPMIPTTASTEPPTTEPPPQPTTETPAYELWYFWLGIAVIVLIIIVGGGIIYSIWKEKLCFAKKKKKPLRTPSYPSTLPPPPPPARHQQSPIEIVTSVPKESQKAAETKNEKSRKHGKAIEESLSAQQPTPTPAASSTPAAEKKYQKAKEKETVADKVSKPKDKKSETPRALKYTNPPTATSESDSNQNNQRPPQKPYSKYPGDKKYLPSRQAYAEKPSKFDDTTTPSAIAKKHDAPPTVTSVTESNRNTTTEQQSKTTDASNKVQTGDSKMNSVASIK